jgi:phosphohistidine phosphatase
MELYFMRHGIAAPEDTPGITSDGERPLTPKGIKRMRKAAKGLLSLRVSFDRVLTSPLLRARQTAQVITEVLDAEERLQEIPELAPERSVQELVTRLADYGDETRILLVGHQPLLGETASFLLSRNKMTGIPLKKGGLCCLEIDDLRSEAPAVLNWMLTPKQLRLLAH